MASKLLQNLADDNPELQKQIGCMTGIFQLFDRQQMVSSRRYGHRRLLPASPDFCNGGIYREYNSAYLRQHADEPVYFVNPSERLRFSTESSRASISSSCSSSLSSLECSRSAQPISSPFDRAAFSKAPSIDPIPKQSGSSSPNLGRKSMDLHNAVKDSMYHEAGRVGLQVKHKKANRISCRDGLMDINNVPADIKESLKVFANLQESPRYYNDEGQLPRSSSVRNQSSQSLARDVPRFSCDGREKIQNHTSFESRETVNSTMKLKELPRLSLDSREGSVQPLHFAMNSNLVQKSSEKISEKRPPNIVAKLMGLEPLPEPSFAIDNAPVALKKPELTEMSTGYELTSCMRGSESLGGSMKELESPWWRDPEGIIRTLPRIPNEPAPWRQNDGNRVLLKPGSKPVKVSAKTRDSIPSVYGEIEKRLKDLEFKQSGKDLRALKQILEAIQEKGLLKSRKEDQATDFGGNRSSLRPIPGTERQQLEQGNHSIASGSRGSDDTRVFESPIVIMKPSKLVEQDFFVDSSSMIPIEDLSNLPGFQDGVPTDTRKGVVADQRMDRDQASKPTRKNSAAASDKKISSKNVKSNQIRSRPRLFPEENSTLPMPKNSSLASPRLPQQKLEPERQAHPPTPPSDTKKSKRMSNRQTSEATSPGGRHRVKYSNSNPCEDQMSEVSIGSRAQSYQGDEVSVHSDGSTFLSSKFDIEVLRRSLPASVQFSESKSMSMDVRNPLVDEDEVFSELLTVATEHHSPVSVLDPSAHIEDDLTPVKIMQNSLRESSALVLSSDCCEYLLDAKINTTSTSSAPEIDRKKLQNIQKLVQKLRQVNSTHDEESTDYIASLCENSIPDHRYISEILLASGILLCDLGSGLETFQFHSSGQPINPKLFYVLEQMKSSGTTKKVQTKVHRKLIFDLVNDILTEKLSGLGVRDEPWLMNAGNLARKMPTAQKLLKELCTETELLDAKKPSSSSLDLPNKKDNEGLKGILWEETVRRTGSWTDFQEDTSSLALGIERLIFKDLVNEILVGYGTGSRAQRTSRRRGLFSS